jgi:hypothetical protein
MTVWLIVVLSAAALTSCEGSPSAARPYAVVFVVESDPGVRLPRTHIFVDGKRVGESDSIGLLRTKIHGRSGNRLRIEHDCPEGHEAPSEPKILRLRKFEGVDRSGPLAMEITLRCRPTKRLAAVVVRAKNGPGLPVLLDGESVARTNASGVAHLSIRGAAGSEYVIELDTTEHPRLLPQFPTRLITLPDADDIFVVNQSFDVEKETGRRVQRRTRIIKIE